METIKEDNDGYNLQASNKNKKTILIIGVVIVILCVPVLLLLFKHKNEVPRNTAITESVNIAQLEALASAKPNYANLVNLSLGYINTNTPGKAINCLKQAIKLDSTKALAYNNLGVANILLKNFNEGIVNCQKAIVLEPDFQLAKNNLKWGMDERNKALLMISKLEAESSNKLDLEYFLKLELNYQAVGDYDKCIATIHRGLVAYPGNTLLLNNEGTALVLSKKYESAIAKFNEVLKAEPANQLAKNNIAWALNEKNAK